MLAKIADGTGASGLNFPMVFFPMEKKKSLIEALIGTLNLRAHAEQLSCNRLMLTNLGDAPRVRIAATAHQRGLGEGPLP